MKKPETLTIEFVDELPKKIANRISAEGAFYDVKKRRVVIKKDESIKTLIHEIGHDVIHMRGGMLEEHELFDGYDCEGVSFGGFARAVDAKDCEILDLKKQVEFQKTYRCRTCKAWNPLDTDKKETTSRGTEECTGFCYRHPPVHVLNIGWTHPKTGSDMGCLDWIPV